MINDWCCIWPSGTNEPISPVPLCRLPNARAAFPAGTCMRMRQKAQVMSGAFWPAQFKLARMQKQPDYPPNDTCIPGTVLKTGAGPAPKRCRGCRDGTVAGSAWTRSCPCGGGWIRNPCTHLHPQRRRYSSANPSGPPGCLT